MQSEPQPEPQPEPQSEPGDPKDGADGGGPMALTIEEQLRELEAPRIEVPEPSAALEAEIVGLWSGCFEDPEPGLWGRGGGLSGLGALSTFAGAHRFAVACGLMFMAVFAACVVPTAYELPLGVSIELSLDGEAQDLPTHELAEFVRETSGGERVDFIVQQRLHRSLSPGLSAGSAQTQISIRVWGQDLPLGDMEVELREAFPDLLGDAEIAERPLEGTVETVWARRLAHRAFHLSLKDADVEEAREQLLLRLYAQGFDEDEVVVKVRDRPDGHREIEIGVERHDVDGESLPPNLHQELQWIIDPYGDGMEERVEVEVED